MTNPLFILIIISFFVICIIAKHYNKTITIINNKRKISYKINKYKTLIKVFETNNKLNILSNNIFSLQTRLEKLQQKIKIEQVEKHYYIEHTDKMLNTVDIYYKKIQELEQNKYIFTAIIKKLICKLSIDSRRKVILSLRHGSNTFIKNQQKYFKKRLKGLKKQIKVQ